MVGLAPGLPRHVPRALAGALRARALRGRPALPGRPRLRPGVRARPVLEGALRRGFGQHLFLFTQVWKRYPEKNACREVLGHEMPGKHELFEVSAKKDC